MPVTLNGPVSKKSRGLLLDSEPRPVPRSVVPQGQDVIPNKRSKDIQYCTPPQGDGYRTHNKKHKVDQDWFGVIPPDTLIAKSTNSRALKRRPEPTVKETEEVSNGEKSVLL